ncbi:Retrovirus-related Pol polyprotein from transposon 17.6 [Dictyocoela muelleri]|nr:Retrovirus-related Pol polyprotein from transposon 17.6 [Dictyocoela muelleri]
MIIELNGLEYQLSDDEYIDNVEEKLMNKTKIYCQLVKKLPNDCMNLLKHNINQVKNIGLVPGVFHEISLKENQIILSNPFRIPLAYKDKLSKLIQDLINDKIIQKSNSPYSSHTFPILKKNGDIRLVIDYRKHNKITAPIPFIFPKI